MSAERFFRPYFDLVRAPATMRGFILGKLRASHRHWHGLLHHALVLRDLKRGGHATESLRRLVLAALFHDIVYDPRRDDNEEASAEVALRWVGLRDADAVVALILATKRHDLHAEPTTRALLLADLGVLWTSSAPLYGYYARGIRAEYAHVPDLAYRAGRKAVLARLHERLADHLDTRHAMMLERNLAGELAGLERGAFDLAC